ncbi:MAG: CHAT domain-containing protein [Phycisphaeraceae bacterium]|nr:CHAT domain-containing protein [Phycisphaeraceae bacterium]
MPSGSGADAEETHRAECDRLAHEAKAFQVAGARATITSLWKVPDLPTQLLMQRFYENLWDRGMGKLAALREAKLWLMREGGKRGLALPSRNEAAPKSNRLPPFFWAGFVLSGDWR